MKTPAVPFGRWGFAFQRAGGQARLRVFFAGAASTAGWFR